MKLSVVSFTEKGIELSKKLNILLGNHEVQLEFKPKPLNDYTGNVFSKVDGMIFIGATGICIRAIAPFVKSKKTDPCVIVIDEMGRFVIPILSGHIGGGNELAHEIAKKISAVPVITTATDINGKIAIDVFAKHNNLYITDFEKAKLVSAEVLNGNIGIVSDFPLKNIPNDAEMDNTELKVGVLISHEESTPFETTLWLIPRDIVLGVGCRRDTEFEVLEKQILNHLEKNNIDIRRILEICSIELKKDEKCIIEFAEKYNLPFKTYTKDELLSAEGQFTSSDFVKNITGVDCVCERSAVLGGGKLITSKDGQNGVTVALGEREWSGDFEY